MPIKKDSSTYSTFLGEVAFLYPRETEIIDEALGVTKSKNELLEEIELLQKEISELKNKLGIEEEIATTEETNEGEVIEDSLLNELKESSESKEVVEEEEE